MGVICRVGGGLQAPCVEIETEYPFRLENDRFV